MVNPACEVIFTSFSRQWGITVVVLIKEKYHWNFVSLALPGSTVETGLEEHTTRVKLQNYSKREWEKICANHVSDKELLSRIYKVHLQLNNKKTTQFKKQAKN